ncbi:MAG TPA: XdhC family protein [Dehalococcoidia bacterium]|nr:XdhC family protein [Dehalococcoidia bacterium]
MIEQVQRLLEASQGGTPVLQATVLEPGPRTLPASGRLLVEQTGKRSGTLGDGVIDDLVAAFAEGAFRRRFAGTLYLSPDGLGERELAGATSVYVEVVASRPVFLVVGAGHIGRCLAKLADLLEFHVVVLDDREEFASEENVPEADEVICDKFGPTLERYPVGGDTHIVLVTRGHKQDEESLRRCVGRGAAYLGMIGSSRRTATVLRHLVDDGLDLAALADVRTPIGLDIGAETPEEIAVSIMAEVIMLTKGGDGQPMYARPTDLRKPQD